MKTKKKINTFLSPISERVYACVSVLVYVCKRGGGDWEGNTGISANNKTNHSF